MAALVQTELLPAKFSSAMFDREAASLPPETGEWTQRRRLQPLLIVIAFACVVNLPCVFWGLQFGHDHNLHITYLHFFEEQLRTGELYPHWISGLNFGAGSPIFFVQYPLPFYAGSVFQWVFHFPATPVGEARALGLFVFLMGIVSGVSSWLWCHRLAGPIVAMLASAIYLTMPYIYGCDVYYRGAIGEYSALAWVPLSLYFAHDLDARPRLAVIGIACAFAALVLSNFFTAVLFTPFLIFYVIGNVPRAKLFTAALLVAAALLLGLGVSSVYFLPMNANRTFFNLANLLKLGPGIFFYRDNLFPFGKTLFPTTQISQRLIDLISGALGLAVVAILVIRLCRSHMPKFLAYAAIICITVTCAAPLLGFAGFSAHPEMASFRVIDVRSRIFLISFITLETALLAYASLRDHAQPLVRVLLISSLACFFLETRWSDWIWRHASFMWNIQFPWRLSGLLSVFSLGLITLALRDIWILRPHRRKALLICGALWLVMFGCGYIALDITHIITPPFVTETKQKVETVYPAYASISQLPTGDELGPNDLLPNNVAVVTGEGTANVDTVSPRHLRLRTSCLNSCTLLVKLVYYPLWQAHDSSNQPIPLHPSNRAGLTELHLARGERTVDLELPVSRSEIWGARLSVISLVLVSSLWLGGYTRNRVEGSITARKVPHI